MNSAYFGAVALGFGFLCSPVFAQEDVVKDPVKSETPVVSKEAAVEPSDVLLMTPTAEVVFITTGGSEVRADWTAQAKENFTNHFQNHVEGAGLSVAHFNDEAELSPELQQLFLLEEVVNTTLFSVIPHKQKSGVHHSDLTLGSSAAKLKNVYRADKALFINHYSQIESGGVFLLSAAIVTATGFSPESQNIRFTRGTVFDLETGNLVSTNVHLFGDPRSETDSERITRSVMKGLKLSE